MKNNVADLVVCGKIFTVKHLSTPCKKAQTSPTSISERLI